MSTKRLLAAGFFKNVWPFSGHQVLEGEQQPLNLSKAPEQQSFFTECGNSSCSRKVAEN